ncbi:MAG: hypothetical protein HQ501_08275 [Rhodospirillales bacterium]|nr:hypothetical protein [Rhodospirillales bacterium]
MDGLSPLFGAARQPIFEGLACAGVPARTIAEMLNVSAPTVSKWRSGKSHIPLSSLVFLTLILAHLIEDAEILERRFDEIGARDSLWGGPVDEQLTTMRRLLREQEVFTSTLAANVVLAGARLYRDWLHAGNSVTRPARVEDNKTPVTMRG